MSNIECKVCGTTVDETQAYKIYVSKIYGTDTKMGNVCEGCANNFKIILGDRTNG